MKAGRMNGWAESGVLENLWIGFLDQLDDRLVVDWDDLFVEGTFSTAKKRGGAWGKRSEGRRSKTFGQAGDLR